MILIIDNYDSFTYNLVQYIGEIRPEIKVVRNDQTTVEEIRELNPEAIVVSPGPKTPKEAGISVDVFKELADDYPILGICLGHQSLGEAFGGKVIHAKNLFHGKSSRILFDKSDLLFQGISSPIEVARYHSLVVEKKSLPSCFRVLSEINGEVMAMKYLNKAVYGLQFHPESILTPKGKQLIKNFIKIVDRFNEKGG